MVEETIGHCLGQTSGYKVEVKYSISDFYGLVKCHKPEWPIRPIITGYNHMVVGAEDYLRPILEPLLKECSFLVDSQKSFQARFLVEKDKFIESEHELFSFDIVSMFTNVNITRTVSYILDMIFQNPEKFLKQEKDSKGYDLPIPTREEFQVFILGVLKDYSFFKTQIGTYKQIRGVQMGSTIAPLIANIFIGCLERSVIKKLIDQGLIISWTRFADDNLAIIRKGSHDTILNAINSWDQNIKYTSAFFLENKLTFLSCTIFLKDGALEFQTYRKAGINTVINNYKKSIMPRRYLISSIFTALNHSKHSCSNDDLFIADLPILKDIFLRNGYPEKIINEKFANFLCSPEKPPQPEVSFTFCIDYTNSKIEYYLRDLLGRIKKFIPNLYVRFAYKTLTTEQIYKKDSKAEYSKLDSCNLIYKFLCTCSKCYVGRTKCTLKIRANQHKQFSRAKKTYYHIHRCPVYVKKLLAYEKEHIPPKSTQTFIKGVRDKFYMSHFKIQQKCGSFSDLCDAESYFIRINLPKLNEQIVHKNFTLF